MMVTDAYVFVGGFGAHTCQHRFVEVRRWVQRHHTMSCHVQLVLCPLVALSLRAASVDTRFFLRWRMEKTSCPSKGATDEPGNGDTQSVRSLATHEGRLVLNRPFGDDRTYVVDTKLFQRRALPPGEWELIFEDGFCAARDCSSEDGAVILME